ncbi:MAG: hypothetical protein M1269_11505 [Chloroflexi bacterium]|nr:hypothetical protein [Chloroflexota bacterium]
MKDSERHDLSPAAKSQIMEIFEDAHKKRVKEDFKRQQLGEGRNWHVFKIIFKILAVVVLVAFVLLILPGRPGFYAAGALLLIILAAVYLPPYLKKKQAWIQNDNVAKWSDRR